MTKRSILIIEDEESILTGLRDVFIYHGFEITTSMNGQQGLQIALSNNFHLLILDIMLPELDGFSICEQVRRMKPELPIIMLTAKTSEDDILTGLTLGADDYIQKPFSITELVLRVNALLRRAYKTYDSPILKIRSISIDTNNLSGLLENGTRIDLTQREVEILSYLLENNHRPVSRDELLEKVWGYEASAQIETRTVDIHIAKLRRKLESNSSTPSLITTVRGKGYKLEVAE